MNSEWVTMQWLSGGLQVGVWPPNNRMWVTHQWFSAKQSHQISSHNQQDVSDTWSDFLPPDLVLWLKGSEWHYREFLPGTFMPITNRKWVTLLWLSDGHSHHISSCDQQFVSDPTVYICQVVSSHLFLWPTACECHWNDFLLSSHLTLLPMTNREWATLQWLSAKQSHRI